MRCSTKSILSSACMENCADAHKKIECYMFYILVKKNCIYLKNEGVRRSHKQQLRGNQRVTINYKIMKTNTVNIKSMKCIQKTIQR